MQTPVRQRAEPGAARKADYHDSYRAPQARPDLAIVDLFFALFGHTPLWMKLLLIARNAAASIGPWSIFFIADNEIVAGRNNRHMEFRLSVLKARDGEAADVVVSTICTVHNAFGKIYLFFIIPFYRSGVRSLISNAVAARRL